MNNNLKNDPFSQTDGPGIQRVVNIKSMRFQSVKQHIEEKGVQALDLNKLNAQRKFSLDQRDYDEYKKSLIRKEPLSLNQEKTKDEISDSQFHPHMSELEINENENIVKTNPLFMSDDQTQMNPDNTASNKKESPFINRIHIQNSSASSESQINTTSNEVNEYEEPIYVDPIELISVEPMFVKEKDSGSLTADSQQGPNQHSPSILSKLRMQAFNIQERKDTEIFEQVNALKNEICKLSINCQIKATDLLFNSNLAFVYKKLWIGRFQLPNITNNLHLGDEILKINDRDINSIDNVISFIKQSQQAVLNITLKRLPYARVIYLSKIDRNPDLQTTTGKLNHNELIREIFGIKLKLGTTKIEKIEENGVFHKNGLKYDPNTALFDIQTLYSNLNVKIDEKDRLTKWVITEINGDYLNYHCDPEEILARLVINLNAWIVLQPYDLVKLLCSSSKKI